MKAKICAECGKEFLPKSGTQKYCNGPHTSKCEVCGQIFEYQSSPREKPKTCSKDCQTQLRARTTRQKYGVDNVSQIPSVRNKISENHKSQKFKDKVKSTCQRKYGVDNPAQSEQVKLKQRETFTQRYGVDNPMKCESVKQKIRNDWKFGNTRQKYLETMLQNHGVHHPILISEVRERVVQSNLQKYGAPFYVLSKEYQNTKVSNVISKLNRQVGSMLESLGLEIEYEFTLESKSYDIYILNSNILIEINPTYTHSTQPNHWNTKSGLDKYYHRDKTRLAAKHNYRCINIWDWDDLSKVLQLVQPSTKLYARNLSVNFIDIECAGKFLADYHIQGNVSGQLIAIGLLKDHQLIQVMTFGAPRYNSNYEWELLRLCTDPRYRVIGGSERLFKHFIAEYHPQSIISYCDTSKFSGDVYSRLGFHLVRTNAPTKHWSCKDKHILDSLLLSRGYDQIFGTSYGRGSNNAELMIQSGWRSVYDCGQQVWEYVSVV